MLKTGVVMVILLMGSDGTVSQGVIPFETFDSCYQSTSHQVDEKYVYVERICMDTGLYDQLTLPRKEKPGTGGMKSDYNVPAYIK